MSLKNTFSLFFLLLSLGVFAQNGLQTQTLYNTLAAQQYQPASLALRAMPYPLTNHYLNAKKWLKANPDTTLLPLLRDSLKIVMEILTAQQEATDKSLSLVGITGNAYIGNNHFGLNGVLKDGNYLTSATIDEAVAKLGTKNRFQYGYNAGFAVNLPIKGKYAWGIYYDYSSAFSVGTNSAGTAGLIFRGNAPYAGTTVSDNNIFLKTQSRTSLGVGWAKQQGKWSVGVKAKFIAGIKQSDVKVKDFSLFTSQEGDSIHASADYEYFVSDRFAPLDGFGAGVDLGAIYQVNNSLSIGGSITNLGFIAWTGESMNKNVDVSYVGFDLKDLLNLEGNTAGQDALVDSLKGLVFPDTVASKMTSGLPTCLHLNATYNVGAYNRVFASLNYGMTKYAPMSPLPLLAFGYQRRVCSALSLGANVYGGGIDTYGVGVMAMSFFRIKHKNPVSILYTMDNILGFVGGKGASAEVGISIGL